jgi:shikimate kinase
MDKLDRWAEDRRNSLKTILDDLDVKLRDMKRDARLAPNLPAKLELQKQLRQMEAKRNEAWREFDDATRDVEKKKDELLDTISKRLEQKINKKELFTVRWSLK